MTDQIFGGTGGGARACCGQYGDQCKCFEKWDAMAKRILAKHSRQPCAGCGCTEECYCECDQCPVPNVSSVDVWKLLNDIRENGNGTSVSFPYEALQDLVQVLVNNDDASSKRIAELTEALNDIAVIAEVGMDRNLKWDPEQYSDHMRYLDIKNIATMAITNNTETK